MRSSSSDMVGSQVPFVPGGAWAIAADFDLVQHFAALPDRQPEAYAYSAGRDNLTYYLTPTGESVHSREQAGMRTLASGSVAVVPVRGLLVSRAPEWMAQYGNTDLGMVQNDVYQAGMDPRVKAIMVPTDSPGGHIKGMEGLATAFRDAAKRKPVIAIVEGTAASAAYVAISACTRIMVSANTSELGSLGAKLEIVDDREYMAKLGMKKVTIYSTKAPGKDRGVRALLERNDTSLLEAEADALTELVHNTATANRPKLKDTALSGDLFRGQQAIDAGLADGFATWDQALALATTNSSNPNPMSKPNLFATAFTALASLFSAKEEAEALKPEQLAEANAKLAEQGVKAELVPTDQLAALRARPESIPAITAEHAEVKPLLEQAAAAAKEAAKAEATAAAQGQLASVLKELNVEVPEGKTAQAVATETLKAWAKLPGATHTASRKEGDEKGDGTTQTAKAWDEKAAVSPAVATA